MQRFAAPRAIPGRAIALAASLVTLAVTLTGCLSAAIPAESVTPTVSAPSAGATSSPSADPLAERDRFLREQQQPLDGSLLSAKTELQRALVETQRQWVESQGGTWTPEQESIILALALDACETSILNGHEIEVSTFRIHVDSSPLIAELIAASPADTADQARSSLVSMMVFGTGYICPQDAPQWERAWEASGDDY